MDQGDNYLDKNYDSVFWELFEAQVYLSYFNRNYLVHYAPVDHNFSLITEICVFIQRFFDPLPGRIGQLPGQSRHRSVREQLTHTIPQA